MKRNTQKRFSARKILSLLVAMIMLSSPFVQVFSALAEEAPAKQEESSESEKKSEDKKDEEKKSEEKKSEDKSEEKPAEKSEDKSEEKPAEKSEDKSEEKPAEKSEDKSEDKIWDETGGETGDDEGKSGEDKAEEADAPAEGSATATPETPDETPTPEPTGEPAEEATEEATEAPEEETTPEPSVEPTETPTPEPTEAPEVLEERTITATASDGASVTITALLPEEAEAVIEKVSLSDGELESWLGGETAELVRDHATYDVSIRVDGETYEPEGSVEIKVKPGKLESGDDGRTYDKKRDDRYLFYTLKTRLVEQTITASASDGASVSITGRMPEGAEAVIDVVKLSSGEIAGRISDADLLKDWAAYDVSVRVDGHDWQPEDTLSVSVTPRGLADGDGEVRAMSDGGRFIFYTLGYRLVDRTITATASDGATVSISGPLPEGAEARIERVYMSRSTLDGYLDEETAENVNDFVAYDVCIVVNGKEYEPDGTVSVRVTPGSLEASETEKVETLHIPEEGEPISMACETSEAGEVSFETDGFSTYVFYTVEFHFDGFTFVMEGGSSILLSELMAQLGIDRDVADVVSVTFSDGSLISIEKVDGDWLLTSLAPFDTTESLVIVFADGSEYVVDVTDDHEIADKAVAGGTTQDFTTNMPYTDYCILKSKMQNSNGYFVDGETLIPFTQGASVKTANGTFVFETRNVKEVGSGKSQTFTDVWYDFENPLEQGKNWYPYDSVTLLFKERRHGFLRQLSRREAHADHRPHPLQYQ